MDRDRRLTGDIRGQIDAPTAPDGFELSNPWRVCICEDDRENGAADTDALQVEKRMS